MAVTYDPSTRLLKVDGHSPMDFPAQLAVEWDAAERRPKDASGAGEVLFVFNADGGARGGRLAVLRGGQGVVFHVNWLFGTVEQATVVAGS